jgi:hypothetical protein
MDSVNSRVRLPEFDGAHKNFQVWWTRFMAFAAVMKITQALKIGGEVNMPMTEDTIIVETTDVGKLQAVAVRRNAIAMANLTMAFTSETTINVVYKAMSIEWPSGLAHLVVAALFKKYRPQDTITRVELRQVLNAIKMKKGTDPATLFEQISSVENKYNTATKKIDQDDLIAVVLDAAPTEYRSLLTSEQQRLGSKMTIDDLEAIMNQYWRQTQSTRNENGDDESDDESDDENETEVTLYGGSCTNCGKNGHLSKDCWLKEENKDKRPSNWKQTGEQGAAVMDDSIVEFLF